MRWRTEQPDTQPVTLSISYVWSVPLPDNNILSHASQVNSYLFFSLSNFPDGTASTGCFNTECQEIAVSTLTTLGNIFEGFFSLKIQTCGHNSSNSCYGLSNTACRSFINSLQTIKVPSSSNLLIPQCLHDKMNSYPFLFFLLFFRN